MFDSFEKSTCEIELVNSNKSAKVAELREQIDFLQELQSKDVLNKVIQVASEIFDLVNMLVK